MTLHINDAGTWRQIQNVYVNDAGTWREIQEVYVNDGGTWRSVFVNDVITISDGALSALSTLPSEALASYTLISTGAISGTENGGEVISGNWITPQANMANYECRATLLSGSITSGTLNAWQSLGSSRAWQVSRSTIGTSTAQLTIEIRRASDAVVMDSGTITLSAQVEAA